MKKNFFCGLVGFTALALIACSDDNGANVGIDPIAGDSSSSVVEQSSSAIVEESSSSAVVESSSSAVAESSSSSLEFSSSDANSSSSSIATSSASECRGLIWYGDDPGEGARVPVETCAESSWPKNVVADGLWRIVGTDNEDGGKSSIIWPVDLVDGIDTMAVVQDSCYGICGTAALDKGSLTYQPFVSIGFTLAKDSSGSPVPVDVSNWGGICISYMSELPPSLELDLGDSVAEMLNYAEPSAGLTKTSTVTSKCIPWSSFKIPSWFKGDDHGWKEDTGAKAAKQLVGVKIRLQEKPKDGGYKFYVQTISAYNSGGVFYAGGSD
ncbi:hypothetical protein [Fibrobacter sp.]|uniref:hypothetical protein n=1 Tax=Fibrobacter sp. TaxID=35828 RepID=UPI0038707D2F